MNTSLDDQLLSLNADEFSALKSALDGTLNTTLNDTGNATVGNRCEYDFQEEAIESRFVLIVGVMASVCIFGTFGNLLIITILTRRRMRSANSWFLVMLAVTDISVMICTVLLYVVEVIYDYFRNLTLYRLWHGYVRAVYLLSHISQDSSIYLTVSATIERFMSLWYPSYNQLVCNQHAAYGWVAVVIFFATASMVTKFFELEVMHDIGCAGFGQYQLAPSELLKNPDYQRIHGVWFTSLAFVFFPFLALTVLNSLIFYRLRYSAKFIRRGARSRRSAAPPCVPQIPSVPAATLTQYFPMHSQRKPQPQTGSFRLQRQKNGTSASFANRDQESMQQSLPERCRLSTGYVGYRRRERKQKNREATVVLFVVVLVFLICNAPALALTLAEHVDKVFLYQNPELYSFSRDGINLLTVINSSANVVIYMVCGGAFRKELKKLCLCFFFPGKRKKFSLCKMSDPAYPKTSRETGGPVIPASGPRSSSPPGSYRPMPSQSMDTFTEDSLEGSSSTSHYDDYIRLAPLSANNSNTAANGALCGEFRKEASDPRETRQPVTYYLAQESITL